MSYPWTYIASWITKPETDSWKQKLISDLTWSQPIVSVYAKKYPVPRLTTFLSDSLIKYRYSGVNHHSMIWPLWFRPLLQGVRDYCNVDFNGCLLNFYRNGNDRMGWHSDNEKELEPEGVIASLSLGASRDFFLRHKKNSTKQSLELNDGDLLIMHPGCQRDWSHSIPSRKKIIEPRLNLTFRRYRINESLV